jgi:hypothetical protein
MLLILFREYLVSLMLNFFNVHGELDQNKGERKLKIGSGYAQNADMKICKCVVTGHGGLNSLANYDCNYHYTIHYD